MADTHRGDGDHLVDAVLDLADADERLPEEAKLVVLAALDGDEALAETMAGTYRPPDRRTERAQAERPVGAFLKTISVRGFRGIGPKACLSLHPAPGLTVVTGRNGSAKSSLSEGLELSLTGSTYRWAKENPIWSQHWRNIHDGTPCEIRVELAEEGVGTTTVGVDWADGAALADRSTWIQRPGQRREPGVSGLGWDRALDLYRPILSYEELGGVLEQRPSALFDKLNAILGIERVTDAHDRLTTLVATLGAPAKAVKAESRELKKALGDLDDDRARQAVVLLGRRSPDLDAVRALATGTAAPSTELEPLRELGRYEPPTRDDVTAVVRELRESATDLARSGAAAVDLMARRVTLLRQALDLHSHGGDGPCPVCGEGTLDAAWRDRVRREVADERAELARYRRSTARHERARSAALALIASVPEPTGTGLESFERATFAWERWSRVPEANLADHMESTYGEFADAFGVLQREARDSLVRYEDAWAPLAARLAGWVGAAGTARENEPTLRTAKAAADFLKATISHLRERELARIGDRAREIWAALRQEGSVGLGAIELKGQRNRRRVELRADVDGTEAEALGVMSQGELHALALALFLPRATVDDSPFRFVVLDDPVQAMDPAKVDGFVDVLTDLAKHRQVIVFTHDNRLPDAVRQMNVNARILEAHRGAKSELKIVSCLDPARQYIEDAFAVAKDDNVPGEVKARIVPVPCRRAIEAAAYDVYASRRFAAGHARGDIEDAWDKAKTVRKRIALALYDNENDGHLDRWLKAYPWRRSAVTIANNGTHHGITRDPVGAVKDVRRTVTDLRAGTR